MSGFDETLLSYSEQLAWTKGWSTLSHNERRCPAVPKLQEVTETFFRPRKCPPMLNEIIRSKVPFVLTALQTSITHHEA